MAKKEIKYQGLSTLEVLVEAKNYNKWIADEIKKYISGPYLEIGAGTGNLTSHFIGSDSFYVTEKDNGLVKHLQNKFANKKNVFIYQLDISKNPPKKFLSFFSSIFAINVLEHIEDDTVALKNLHRMLKEKGRLILLVPAKKRAYTKLDKSLGHYRRYEYNELSKKLSQSGYEIEKIYFFNIVGLLSWVIRDKVNRKNIHLKPYHIKIFDFIVPFLRFMESVIKTPVGISLVAVAKKV